MSEGGISSHNILEERLRDEPKEHLCKINWNLSHQEMGCVVFEGVQ